MISPAEYVIRKFGGLTGLANATNTPVTTVQGWRERKRIPQDHWQKIISAAKARDRLLTLEDFLSDHPGDDQEAAA